MSLPPTSTRRTLPREVDYADVDDLIGIASELQLLSQDRLSVEDLTEVARDLDIPDRFVRPAIAELARRREALLAAEARRRRTRRWIILGAVGVVAVFGIWALVGQASLGSLAAVAAQKRAQVVSVTQRQQATERQWQDVPHSEQRAAELSGAENRVRIERKSYDEAATAYNMSASVFPGSLWASLFGYPDALPLSNAIEAF